MIYYLLLLLGWMYRISSNCGECVILNDDSKLLIDMSQVCHRFYSLVRSRDLWTQLALERVIQLGLPWPSHAWPLADLPTRTVETLVIRATILARRWDGAQSPSRVLHPSAHIRRPQGSVSWCHLFRSKYLLLGHADGYLQAWDVQDAARPVLCASLDVHSSHIYSGTTFYHAGQTRLAVTTKSSAESVDVFDDNFPSAQ